MMTISYSLSVCMHWPLHIGWATNIQYEQVERTSYMAMGGNTTIPVHLSSVCLKTLSIGGRGCTHDAASGISMAIGW